MSDISEKGSDFLRDLGNAARKNPLSAALIGMGVFSLFTGSRPVERAADFVRRTGFDRIPDAPAMLLRPPVRPLGPAPVRSASTSRQQRTLCETTARTLSIVQLASDGIIPTLLPIMPELFLVPGQRCSTRPAPT